MNFTTNKMELINWENDSLSKNYSNFLEDMEMAEEIAEIVNKS